jgi:micrococcal nuclease
MLMVLNLLNGQKRVIVLVLLAFFLFPAASPDDIVYITYTGTRYHLDGCSSLERSQIAVSLLDAIRSGYVACRICRPPAFHAVPRELAGPELYRVNIEGHRNSADADTSRMLRARVVGHIDGDTVRVRIDDPPVGKHLIETIRFLGVDTPETVHPNRQAEHFGLEASEFTRAQLFGKDVYLAFDWDLRDRFGRLLAYIYTEQVRNFSAVLIREGYGHALLRFPFQFMEEFRNLEDEARREGRGLWAE